MYFYFHSIPLDPFLFFHYFAFDVCILNFGGYKGLERMGRGGNGIWELVLWMPLYAAGYSFIVLCGKVFFSMSFVLGLGIREARRIFTGLEKILIQLQLNQVDSRGDTKYQSSLQYFIISFAVMCVSNNIQYGQDTPNRIKIYHKRKKVVNPQELLKKALFDNTCQRQSSFKCLALIQLKFSVFQQPRGNQCPNIKTDGKQTRAKLDPR